MNHNVLLERRSGILLHPTSLPGPHGNGDFGPDAYRFIDWLAHAGQRLWQILPLNPIGPGQSPYSGASAFAGNPLLVALEPLQEQGWLEAACASDAPPVFDPLCVDFAQTIPWRMDRLRQAWAGFQQRATPSERAALANYIAAQRHWLDDYALFMVIDEQARSQGEWRSWHEWEPALARREPQALADVRALNAPAYGFWCFVQWCFETQWQAVRAYAAARDVAIVGDLPIFVAHHSADCWARPDLYHLDARGEPTVVAGVPPDFFSAQGQRWGNPLYRWDRMQAEGFAWWIARVQRQLALADVVRIDHFRGFAACWEIPADCPTAIDGHWVGVPGQALFEAIRAALGELPIIAEDLGVITPDVEALRDSFGFPGMKILQFGFSGDASHAYLPHNYPPGCVAYTGTHDNDTALGWWDQATEHERSFARHYLRTDGRQVHRDMWNALLHSPARAVLLPMQDALGLGSEHRMNTPGQLGAWSWRFDWSMVPPTLAPELAGQSAEAGRAVASPVVPGLPR